MSDALILNPRWSTVSKFLVLLAAVSVGGFLAIGQVRLAVAAVFLMLFLLASVRVSWGIMIFFSVLPFLGFIRRVFSYHFGVVRFDPFLIVPDVMTIALFLMVIFEYREELLKIYQRSKTAKALTFFAVFLFLQGFNPIQGSVALGLSGIKFYVVPILWAVIGYFQEVPSRERLLRLMAVLTLIAAVYGFTQYYFGYTMYEKNWVQNVDFNSLIVGNFYRPLSFFNSPEEYSRFLQLGAGIILWLVLRSKNMLGWGVFLFVAYALFQSAVRTSIFGIIVMLGLLWAFWPRIEKARKQRIVVMFMLGLLVFGGLSRLNLSDVFISRSSSETSALIEHATIGTLNPLRESSLQSRLWVWASVLKRVTFENPLGYGLGTTTTGASKFVNQVDLGNFYQKESYMFSVLFSSGIVGFILLIVFWVYIIRRIWFSLRDSDTENILWAFILAGLIITSVFGNSATLYSIAPFYYYLIGQVLRNEFSEKT